MYTTYWNLRASPFLNADNEEFLYPSEQLQEGVARLFYLIDQERIAGMVTGPYGVGKTFLLSCLVRRTQKLKLPFIRSAAGEKPLFTTVLSGTPALARSVEEYESLRRRIQLAWSLDPLSREQTIEYVQQHIRAAGGDIWAFSREALDEVHRLCGGIPRSINNLCDTSLMLGYAAERRRLADVRSAALHGGTPDNPVHLESPFSAPAKPETPAAGDASPVEETYVWE